MELSPFLVASGAVALAIGQYALLSYHIGRDYVQRYRDMKTAFTKWQDEETQKFLDKLQDRAVDRDKESPEDILKFVHEWVAKGSAVKWLDSAYWHLDSITSIVLMLSSASFLTGILALFQPEVVVFTATANSPVHWLEISVSFFGIAVAATLYYVWRLQRLTSIIARFEIDRSVEDLVKLLVDRSSR